MSDKELWSGLDLVARLNARVSGAVPARAGGISIDTRTIEPGDLFFAIRGENSDGHDHVAAAFDKGAAAAVVDEAHSDALRGSGSLYVVHDVLGSLEALGRAARDRSGAWVIAVTGSVGKTSTKEALRTVLSEVGPTHASAASYNNHWGVPLTLARMPAESRFGVFEIGMNHAGEITPLVDMVSPHIAIVTTVAPVHLEFFSGVEAIADAKSEIFSGLVPGGVAIIHRDCSTYERLRSHADASAAGHCFTFGEHEDADARLLTMLPVEDGSLVKAEVLGQTVNFHLGAPGRHMAVNALSVLLAARAADCDLTATAEALSHVRAGQGRGARTRIGMAEGDFTLIDESYNANPASMRAALNLLGAGSPGPSGRRIAVMGEMRELGADGAALHRDLADDVRQQDIDLVFAAGPLMKGLYDALPSHLQGSWAETATGIEQSLIDTLRPGDLVMVKGSNASRMGPLVQSLKHHFGAAGASPGA